MTGQELVAFAKSKLGVPYVYGMKGKVMTEAIYNSLKKAYGIWFGIAISKKLGKFAVIVLGLSAGQRALHVIPRITMIQLWKYSPLQPLPTHLLALPYGEKVILASISEMVSISLRTAVHMAVVSISCVTPTLPIG